MRIRWRHSKLLVGRTAEAIKDFLLSQKSREFFLFMFFFCVAGGFWLLQTLNNDYESEFSLPLRLKGVPNNVVLTSELPSEVRVRVRDKGTVLFNYMVAKSFYPVTLDFSDYPAVNHRVALSAAQVERKVMAQMNASTQLLSIKPDTLEYIYCTGEAKRVPVRLQGHVSAGRQYYLSDTLFQPDSVLVYAPRNQLDTIHEAYTHAVSFADITDTLRRMVPLAARRGVKFVPAAVELMLPVDVYTEKSVDVPLVGVNFPAGKELRAFPSTIQITFQVGMSRFRQINAEDFHLSVSYEELLRLGSDKYTIQLKHIPEGASHIRCNPSQVDFLIEQTYIE